jgi:broad specificity phosphatase PhoE
MKTLYFIRHGIAEHNINYLKFGSKTFYDPKFTDTKLVSPGIKQALDLRNSWTELKDIELILVSSLMRTLQTADIIFNNTDKPIIALDYIREYPLGLQTCNKRSSKEEYIKLFPKVDFSSLQTNNDELWFPKREENIDELNVRIEKLMEYVKSRSENIIAIVNHSSFIGQLKDKEIKYMDDGKEELKHCFPYKIEI